MLARDQLRVQVYQRTCLPALARRGQQWSSKYCCLLSANPLPSPLSTTFSLISSRPPSAIARVPKVLKPCSAYPKKARHKLFSLCNILWKCIVICTLKCIATSEGSLEQWHCILFPCQVLPLIHNADSKQRCLRPEKAQRGNEQTQKMEAGRLWDGEKEWRKYTECSWALWVAPALELSGTDDLCSLPECRTHREPMREMQM